MKPHRRWLVYVLMAQAVSLAGAGRLVGQDRSYSETASGPRFLLAAKTGLVPLDIARTPVLAKRISLAMDDAPIKQVLAAITQESGIHFAFTDDMFSAGKRIRIRADELTVAAVLTDVLFGAGVDVVFGRDGWATLVRRAQTTLPDTYRVGVLTGRITESASHAPLAAAQVTVLGPNLTRSTDAKGDFMIPGVPSGEYTVTVRRLGFTPVSRKVRFIDNERTTFNAELDRTATALTEIVTTATGERSRLEVGNSIGTIKADSIVSTALIRNMSDLLTARTPGAIVTHSVGQVGAPSIVRIRGVSSISLNSDPIIVLDGIRLTPASYGPGSVSLGAAGPGTSTNRLDDIDPNTIESIDILRGPSASSLYGSDAAAGVIVIRTKKGGAGPWRSTLMLDRGFSTVPAGLPSTFITYGHTPNGVPTLTCPFVDNFQINVLSRTCVQDSVKAFGFYNDPRLTSLGTGTAQKLNGTVSGGTDQLREFLSASMSDEVGAAKLPQIEEDRIARMWGEPAPGWMKRPNAQQDVTVASRTNLQFTRALDVSLTANGIYRNTLTGGGPGGRFVSGGITGSTPSATDLFVAGDTMVYLPAELNRQKRTSLAKRGYVAAAANYNVLSWLQLHGTLGGDYTLRTNETLTRPQDCTAILNLSGCTSQHMNDRTESFVTTMDVGANATWAPRSWVSFRTATGEQIVRTTVYDLLAQNASSTTLAFGTDLLTPSPIATTTGGQLFTVTENRDANATAGWYLEETVALLDRLFLTAGFRQDVASSFGANVNADHAPVYPKYSLSWLVSDEPFFPKGTWMSSFRLRTAYGHSGQEARQTDVLSNFITVSSYADGAVHPAVVLATVGNADLRPERSAEWEGGFDLSLLENERFHVEATVYRKLASDAIASRVLPYSTGYWHPVNSFGSSGASVSYNVGKVENRGWELSTTAKVIDRRAIGYDITINASRNVNKLVTAANNFGNPGANSTSTVAGGSLYVGYPLESNFGRNIVGYADVNGDGILERSEVQLGVPLVFRASPNPEAELSYGHTLRLLNGAVQVHATFDQLNGILTYSRQYARTGFGLEPLQNSFVNASLAAQAAWWQNNIDVVQSVGSKVNALRFSELSVMGTLPSRLSSAWFHVRSTTLVLAARNLAFWTNGTDPDPTMTGANSAGTDFTTIRSAGTATSYGVPTTRDFTLRINLGF